MSRLSTQSKAEYDREKNRRKREMGRCVSCPQQARPGKCYCQSCADRRSQASKEKREKRRRILCYVCPNPVTPGKVYCLSCGKKNREAVDRRAAKSPINPRTLRERQYRRECVEHYGGVCVTCGEKEFGFLTIDHVAGGGSQHRKKEQTWRIGNYLRKRGFPPGFQVMCFNCNHLKYLAEKRANQLTTKKAAWARNKLRRKRLAIMERFGGPVCVCCGDERYDVLTVDHIEGGGGDDRRKYPEVSLYRKFLLTEADVNKFRILCFNCNSGRAVNGGVCPHASLSK